MQRIDYRQLFLASPSPYLAVDTDGVILDVNPAMLRITSRQRDQLIGQHIARIFPSEPDGGDDGRRNFMQNLQRSIQTGQPESSIAMHYPARAGQATDRQAIVERYVDFTFQPITDPDTGSMWCLLIKGHDITEQKRNEEQIWHEANYDALTGLANRRLFRDRLDHEVKRAQRNRISLALLFIDLDHFKEANDLLGHDVGDLLLCEAGQRIVHAVRASDTVARLGGDEFTVILNNVSDNSHVERVAQAIVDALAQPFRPGDEMVYLSGSVGITLYDRDASNSEDLIRNADQAMYAAKNAGRNRFSFFTPSMQELAHNRLRMIGDLREALSQGQLEVWYQPVIDLNGGHIAKAEALLRWHHPRLGWIEPSHFIPLAAESGLINEIGHWVFTEAAACARRWGNQREEPFQIGVNKSPVQFHDHGAALDWATHLKAVGLTGGSIAVEITEGLLLKASDAVVSQLLQYRDAGIQVALDDFGTGYSSMAYLQKFDIDYLKIDQSFVQNLESSPGDQAIVRSMVAMAHELGLKVIAEGIETRAQQALLLQAGCDYGQGFLFSRAVPARDFDRLLLAPVWDNGSRMH